MTPTEYNQRLQRSIREMKAAYESIVRTVDSYQANRIFIHGGLGNRGTQQYLYGRRWMKAGRSAFINPAAFKPTGFQPFNKAQRQRSGKKGYYFMLFRGGYGQFKRAQGLPASFVNLTYSGQFQAVWRRSLKKLSQTRFVRNLSGKWAERFLWLSKKYGRFNNYSEQEIDLTRLMVQEKWQQILVKNGIA